MLVLGDIAAMCAAAFDVPSAPTCGADCNDDGVVTAADLTCLANCWPRRRNSPPLGATVAAVPCGRRLGE